MTYSIYKFKLPKESSDFEKSVPPGRSLKVKIMSIATTDAKIEIAIIILNTYLS